MMVRMYRSSEVRNVKLLDPELVVQSGHVHGSYGIVRDLNNHWSQLAHVTELQFPIGKKSRKEVIQTDKIISRNLVIDCHSAW